MAHALGGYRVQGRESDGAERLVNDAKTLEGAGAFAIVLELVPAALAERITKALTIPTIGIGAGPHCDGQVLVLHDMLGLNEHLNPKFLKRYANLADQFGCRALLRGRGARRFLPGRPAQFLTLQQIGDPLAVREWSRKGRAAGKRIGFVPTMGYLHEGHLRLVDRAREESDLVAMSIFVNPLQFGPKEDLASYPRDLARDRALAEQRGVDCLFVPDDGSMYPEPPLVRVTPGELSAHLCGPWRPGHFEGVLTVVAKLFHILEPDVAVFGRKDVQQARMIVRMVNDLHFPLSIVIAPTMREADGLAMSSRNTYLSASERQSAVDIAGPGRGSPPVPPGNSRGIEHRTAGEGNDRTRSGHQDPVCRGRRSGSAAAGHPG